MADRAHSPERLIQYLLGELSDEDAARIEDQVFAEEEPYALLRAAEDDLVDAYVAGALPPGRVHRFEARFLASDGGKKKVAIAKALAKTMPAPAIARAPATDGMLARVRAWTSLRWVRVLAPVAAAALLLVVFLPPAPTEIALVPMVRGASIDATVPRRDLRLALRADGAPAEWRVVVERGGAVVFETRGAGAIQVEIPKSALAPGLHDVRLEDAAGHAVEHYGFRVDP